MCELLGMSANVPTDICFSFTGLVQRGGGTGPHKDGWGITFYEGKGCRTFKDPQPSFQSPIAKLVQDYPIKSCSVVAHIRQANRGRVALENTHTQQCRKHSRTKYCQSYFYYPQRLADDTDAPSCTKVSFCTFLSNVLPVCPQPKRDTPCKASSSQCR